ncbi:MAG: hypothetical protein EA397_12320 [Deltaproteobacteria bacterium]|nr:MAG: hypothetical protein EA397_12320 [Deltaproteobacteria bacterium]
MIGIPIGLAYANALEWAIHKVVLHDMGRKRDRFWSFHMHDHHRASVLNDFYDPDYEKPFWATKARRREVWTLAAATALHLPLAPVAPFFTGTVIYSAVRYYQVHKKSHLDPAWAVEHLPWHVDHHMGRNPDMNWCVTHPFFDHVMGTRQPTEATQPTPAPQASPGDAAIA